MESCFASQGIPPALDFPSLWLCYHTFLDRRHMQQSHQKIKTTNHYDLGPLKQGHLKPHCPHYLKCLIHQHAQYHISGSTFLR